jgi:photosystem II stability/assembly factor-like uncharacterized protein
MRQKLLLFASVLSLTFFSQKSFGQWVQTNAVPGDSVFTDGFAVSGSNLIAGTEEGQNNEGILLSTDHGATWVTSTAGLPTNENVYALTVSGENSSSPMLFAGTADGVFLSTDHGRSWTASNNGLPEKQNPTSFAVIGANSSSPTIFVGSNLDGVFYSTDNGTSWTASGLTNKSIFALAVSGTNLIAAVDDPSAGIFLSTDNGLNWTADTTGLPQYEIIQCFAISEGNLFAGTANSVFLSTNNGLSWSAAHTGLENAYVHALAASGSNIFAATRNPNDSIGYDGVFLSTNNGASWDFVNTGLENTNIDVWTLAVIDTFLYAGSQTSSLPQFSDIWRRPLSQMIGSSAVSQNSHAVESAVGAFPNPFPAKTTVTISPLESDPASITIVNLLGQEVAHLFDGELAAGSHSFTWDASNAAPGRYWCIAHMGGSVERIALSVQR